MLGKMTTPRSRQNSWCFIEIEDVSSGGYLLPQAHRPSSPPPRGTMFRKSKEYSLTELLEHPVLGLLMTSQGIERRSVELMVDMQSCERRHALVDEPVVD